MYCLPIRLGMFCGASARMLAQAVVDAALVSGCWQLFVYDACAT